MYKKIHREFSELHLDCAKGSTIFTGGVVHVQRPKSYPKYGTDLTERRRIWGHARGTQSKYRKFTFAIPRYTNSHKRNHSTKLWLKQKNVDTLNHYLLTTLRIERQSSSMAAVLCTLTLPEKGLTTEADGHKHCILTWNKQKMKLI